MEIKVLLQQNYFNSLLIIITTLIEIYLENETNLAWGDPFKSFSIMNKANEHDVV